jgi:hypothetical protein
MCMHKKRDMSEYVYVYVYTCINVCIYMGIQKKIVFEKKAKYSFNKDEVYIYR